MQSHGSGSRNSPVHTLIDPQQFFHATPAAVSKTYDWITNHHAARYAVGAQINYYGQEMTVLKIDSNGLVLQNSAGDAPTLESPQAVVFYDCVAPKSGCEDKEAALLLPKQ